MQTRKRLPLTLVSNEGAPLFKERRNSSRDRRTSDVREVTAAGKFQAVFECVSDALVTIDGEGRMELINPAAEELTGYLRAELVGRPIESLSPKTISARTRTLSKDSLATSGTYEDIALETKDGLPRFVDVSVRVMGNTAGKPDFSVVVFRDVTEKKRMERELITKHAELRNAFVDLERVNAENKAAQESLVQAGKMAALGELAAGIAHELNQPLMAIRGYAQELEFGLAPVVKGLPVEGEVSIGLKEIISSSDKMAKIISHLRTFTRKSTEDFAVVDVRLPIEEALKMVSRQLASRGVEVTKKFEPGTTIYANPLSLEQVFINLTTNARDAIEATGRGRGTIAIEAKSDGAFVEVRVRDDGVGMAQGTKAKAFNPFFTTKEVGKGMGLGLSLSYGILSKVHGSIRIESAEGKGTTFIIRIPKDFRDHG
jgi:two-component system, NtrC family, phosphoglycerate transport system sensor histidine kinase PgtB